MTPPPEQYVIEIPRRLPRASTWTGARRPSSISYVPVFDLLAIALVATAPALLGSPLSPGVLLVPAVLCLTAPIPAGNALNAGVLEDLGGITRRCAAAFAVTAAAAALLGATEVREALAVSVASFPALLLARGSAYALHKRRLRRGRLSPALVIGTGSLAQELIGTLRSEPDYGLNVIGALGKVESEAEGDLGTRLLGSIKQAADAARYWQVRTVIVASDGIDDRAIAPTIRRLLEDGLSVWLVPRFFQLGADAPTQHIGGIPVVRLQAPARKRPGWSLKRVLDVAVAGTGLVVSAPVLGLIAVAVKLDSRGPVLFRQRRVGLHGRPFHILKFRTMVSRSELREQTEWSPEQRHITRVGRVLRATSLDELPQLVNVLRGELTLVGPRPERPAFVKIFEEEYEDYANRHRVPAGITGWAQIHGLRGDTSIADRARFDNHYIENWSLARDVKILLLTARVFSKRYRPPQKSEQHERNQATNLADVG